VFESVVNIPFDLGDTMGVHAYSFGCSSIICSKIACSSSFSRFIIQSGTFGTSLTFQTDSLGQHRHGKRFQEAGGTLAMAKGIA
jgi:hypothetical protein